MAVDFRQLPVELCAEPRTQRKAWVLAIVVEAILLALILWETRHASPPPAALPPHAAAARAGAKTAATDAAALVIIDIIQDPTGTATLSILPAID
ncbi:MAG: hypothetical protein ACP5M3_08225 [Acidithiobacillus sp.]